MEIEEIFLVRKDGFRLVPFEHGYLLVSPVVIEYLKILISLRPIMQSYILGDEYDSRSVTALYRL